MKERIQWLAVLRGLNIIFVVMGHVQLIDMSTGLNHDFCLHITNPFGPFRMPLFIFCSGGLLYLSRIQKQWEIKELYIDKFYRILCPFLFFVVFYYFFKLALNPFTKTKVIFSIGDFLESFAVYYDHPSAHLWFLPVLLFFMLLYPLFKWLCRNDVGMWTFLLLSIVFYHIDTNLCGEKNYFFIDNLHFYLVFFFFGIFFFKYTLYRYLSTIWILIILVILYTGSYLLTDMYLVTSLLGILMMIALSQQIALYYPSLFSSFREYIYQIYLMSFIFQPFVELILWKKYFYNETFFLLFYLLNILSGIYLPVMVSKLVERYGNKWMKICLGLKAVT